MADAPLIPYDAPVKFVPVFDTDIPGDVVGKGRGTPVKRRKRAGNKVREYMSIELPKKTQQWHRAAVAFLKEVYTGEPIGGILGLKLITYKRRPGYLQRVKDADEAAWCPYKPDGDNIQKIVADALVDAGVIEDDRFIVRWTTDTLFTSKEDADFPFVFVEVSQLQEGE